MTDTTTSIAVNNAILEYYQLKQKYETKLDRQRHQILKNSSLTLRQKKRKYQEIQKNCVNCGKKGGTLFKTEGDLLIATCNSTIPCNLNIKINRGIYKNLYDQKQILDKKV